MVTAQEDGATERVEFPRFQAAIDEAAMRLGISGTARTWSSGAGATGPTPTARPMMSPSRSPPNWKPTIPLPHPGHARCD
ncbi:MAG: hypothetical protein R3A10_14010 [Caldilineaceae bacterium]